MTVYIIGNLLVKSDNVPVKLLPKLRKKFPQVVFEEIDPTENFIPAAGSIIIDTVAGIEQVTLLDPLEEFLVNKSVSSHDYDLGFHLKLLQKTGKLRQIKILGIPLSLTVNQVLPGMIKKLKSADIEMSAEEK